MQVGTSIASSPAARVGFQAAPWVPSPYAELLAPCWQSFIPTPAPFLTKQGPVHSEPEPPPRGNCHFGLFPIETLPTINSWQRSRADRAPRSEPCGLSAGGVKLSAPGLPVLGWNVEAKSFGGHSGWLEMER